MTSISWLYALYNGALHGMEYSRDCGNSSDAVYIDMQRQNSFTPRVHDYSHADCQMENGLVKYYNHWHLKCQNISSRPFKGNMIKIEQVVFGIIGIKIDVGEQNTCEVSDVPPAGVEYM